MDNLIKAVKDYQGGQAAVARKLETSPQFLCQMLKEHRPIPPRFCPVFEEILGIRCEQLRGDLAWTRGTDGKITGYHVALTANGVDRPL